jgi:hypothetical protein
MRRAEDERARLRALVDGGSLAAVSARFGADGARAAVEAASLTVPETLETAR